MIQPEHEVRRPTAAELEKEIKRRKTAGEYRLAVWGALRTLLIFAAAAVLISTLLFPVIRVQQNSMTPTLQEGDLLIFITAGQIKKSDVIAFHYNDQVLIKRIIAVESELIDIGFDGVVTINSEPFDEPYISSHSFGECTIELPLQVAANQFFVMGDHRETSKDSRIKEIGTIHKDRMIGKAIIRIWPINRIGLLL